MEWQKMDVIFYRNGVDCFDMLTQRFEFLFHSETLNEINDDMTSAGSIEYHKR